MRRVAPRRPELRPVAAAAAALIALAAITLVAPRPAGAQYLTRPQLEWRTLETEHFTFHFPASMAPWTREVATRMEGVHEAVAALVGHVPERRVTVMVEDPSNVSNGFALPFRDRPTIFLWPTPPDPTSSLSHLRGWGELLAVHEFAHIAHLVRPSRNRWQRRLWELLPVDLDPITRRSPRWVTEGYATFVEGRLTGSGRPASVGRAAILRQWALEGQLPTYAELDGTRRFLGGSMAYLAGSAYLEWLVEREGEESLPHLWRRMTARADRGFVPAFTGVFGAAPAELYGRFTAELTRSAMAVEDSLRARGIAEGELVQRLTSATGAPAISPDGQRIAIVLRSETRPSRLVVWATEPDSAEVAAADSARARLIERDPEDVPAVRRRPAPRRALHTLPSIGGRGHVEPRFLPDGESVLVVRSVPQGDGTERPELFVWRLGDGDLRRVTRGGAIRDADPAPDGRSAAAVRCLDGLCALVRVSLDDGSVTELVPGSVSRAFHRPRWSPDGRSLLVAVHQDGRWRLALLPAAGDEPRFVDPDDGASRYGADFLPGGREVVTTSERGGIAHLERLDLETGRATPLTRTTGAHLAPEVTPAGDTVYFLALHARGYDLRRVPTDAVLPEPTPTFAAAFGPAVPPPTVPPVDSFPATDALTERPYGLGPRSWQLLPAFVAAPDGISGTLALEVSDPVGRLAWLLQGTAGERGSWQGGALSAELRTFVPYLRGDVFATRHAPSTGDEGAIVRTVAGNALDGDYAGVALGVSTRHSYALTGWSARAGISAGRLEVAAAGEDDERLLAHGTVVGTLDLRRDRDALTQMLRMEGAAGRTLGERWSRTTATYDLGVTWRGRSVRGSATGGVVSSGAPTYEAFVLGGVPSPLLAPGLLDQRRDMPAIPFAVATGIRLRSYRVETDLLGAVAYVWGASAGSRFDAPWHRVVGLEKELAFAPVSFLALPGVHLRGGVARSLDEPFEDRTRVYFGVRYRP
ncbi:MAG TPA: hypothetical protein VGE02_10275 [Gemmatimonadales bacterium]